MKTVKGKVVAVGSQGVGKTSMIIRYIGKTLNEHVDPTIGASFFTCKLNLENSRILLQVWDTAGQEKFRSMAPMYYRNANAAMLVFDLTQYSTFIAMKGWVAELRKNVEGSIVLVVIGNKSDLKEERQVNTEEGQIYATKIGAIYHETSVVQDEGIDDVFLDIAKELLTLSSSENGVTTIRVCESNNSAVWSDTDVPVSPTVEGQSQNVSIAHRTLEKPYTCC